MALTLTPDMLDAAYSFLRVSPPFDRWGLPLPFMLKFEVIRSTDYMGWFVPPSESSNAVKIQISGRCVGHTDTLLRVMAHEMIHAHQWFTGKDTRSLHNADFRKKAARVCAAHGWDPKLFV